MRYKWDGCDAIIDTQEDDRIMYDDINQRSGWIIEDLMNENESLKQENQELKQNCHDTSWQNRPDAS